ncbi:MAG: translation initiation factor 1 [Parvicellaceae bacterium]|jgi:translation initiation factor 1
MGKNKNKRVDVVYSTNPDYAFDHEDQNEEETLSPSEQHLTAIIDRKMRKGKAVSIILDFVGTLDDMKDLGKTLKVKCGVGGSVKDGEIILQGEVRDKAVKLLEEMGYNVKKSGN